MDSYFDKSMGQFYPLEQEETIEECEYCGADLYTGERVLRDDMNQYYCSEECYLDQLVLDIQPVTMGDEFYLGENGDLLDRWMLRAEMLENNPYKVFIVAQGGDHYEI
jgi:ribosomal protein L24E